MRLVGAGEYAERSVAIFAFAYELVEGFEVGIITFARIRERKDLRRVNMFLAAQGKAIAERFEIVNDAFGAVFGESVVRIGTALDRVKAGIDIVSGWRAHRCRLEALGKTHPFGCECE